jgi:isocitrate/isopropylmalate dehydrogenase
MPHRIALISEDGARPEITQATVHVVEATDDQFDWDVKEASIGTAVEYGSVLPWRGVRAGRPAIGQLSERMSKRSNTSCAETHSKHRE